MTLSSSKTQYPCPACVGSLPPGTGTMSLEKMLSKGSGKVYYPYSGAVNITGTGGTPAGNWYDCPRCKGSGMVDDRRKGPRDRRESEQLIHEVSRRIRVETNLRGALARIAELEAAK